jgi:hypothetical protein
MSLVANHTVREDVNLTAPYRDLQPMRPEIEVLLCCARTQLEATFQVRLETLLKQPLNWDVLYTAAARHGLLPLLYWHLAALEAEGPPVPSHVLAEFRREFEVNAARSFFLSAELLQVLSNLDEENVRAAAYKGPSLAFLAYGNLLLRPFCDLDILIERRDLERVHTVLEALGYAQQFHSNHHSNEYAHSFVRQDESGNSVVIEVHWSITPRNFALPPYPPGALQRLIALPLQQQGGARAVLSLSHEDHLLVLCWHGYKHHWSRLEWIACIAELVRAAPVGVLDWNRLLRLARGSGSQRLLWCGLGLAETLLHVPLPDVARSAMQRDKVLPSLLPALVSKLTRWTGSDSTESDLPLDLEISMHQPPLRFFHLASRERWQDKLRYGWRTAFSPGQMDWRGLPSACFNRIAKR